MLFSLGSGLGGVMFSHELSGVLLGSIGLGDCYISLTKAVAIHPGFVFLCGAALILISLTQLTGHSHRLERRLVG